MTQPAAAPLSGAAVRQAPRLQSRRLPGRPGVARAASSADSQETGEPNGGLNTTFSALAAAGVAAMAAGVVQTGVVPAALPPQVLSTAAQVAQASVQNAVPLLGGTAVATSAAAVATTASAKRERGQQRVRLEQLKKEVAALQVRFRGCCEAGGLLMDALAVCRAQSCRAQAHRAGRLFLNKGASTPLPCRSP